MWLLNDSQYDCSQPWQPVLDKHRSEEPTQCGEVALVYRWEAVVERL